MKYKYDTHLHTSQGSACAVSTGAELVDFYKANGYSGFAVTDHFMNGNTAVSRELPWAAQVDAFCVGYEDAKRRGDEVDFDVFFGLEFNYKGTEFLVFGLEKEWLKKHQIIMRTSLTKALQIIHTGGGMIVHAHPFRVAPYIKTTRLIPEYTDAVEIKNGGNSVFRGGRMLKNRQDELAEIYADMLGKPVLSGTDLHSAKPGAQITGGIITDFRLKTPRDFITTVLNGDCALI